MKRILVPTDFSMEAENAIQTAIPIAQAFKAVLVLLHVLEVSSKDSFSESSVTDSKEMVSDTIHINENLKSAQENFTRSYALHGLADIDVEVEQYIRVGNPNKQIEESIEKENIDFIIMGTKEAWGLNDILLGTSTDKLLRKVNCPVLSVNEVAPADAFSKIVFSSKSVLLFRALRQSGRSIFRTRILFLCSINQYL